MNWKFWERWTKKPPSRVRPRRRGYQAGGSVDFLANWLTSPAKPNEDIKHGLRVMQARSREALQNNPYIRRILTIVNANVVGPEGPILQSKAVNGKGKEYKPARMAIENAWKRWGKKGSPDITFTKSWNGMLQEFWRQIFIDGEYLAVEMMSAESPFGLKLQVIDPMLLDNDLEKDFKDGRYIKQGVEYNQAGRPLAYHILKEDPQSQYYAKGKSYERIPASRVHHTFIPDFVNQRRGVPLIITILQRLVMMGKYSEAELVASVISSAKMGAVEDGPENQGWDGTGRNQNTGELEFEVSPGMLIKLPHGSKIHPFDPQHPGKEFGTFMKIMLREVASGVNASYSALANDYSDANYSSLRQAALTEQEIWKMMQNFMVEEFVDPVFESFLETALVLQAINIGNRPLANDFNRFEAHIWRPKRWAWVDPMKEMGANALAMDYRTKSAQQVIIERGDDPDEVLEQIREWNEATKDLPDKTDNETAKALKRAFFTPGESDDEQPE